jgi:hypothetical protein
LLERCQRRLSVVDVDNLLKPAIDAMQGLVFVNDNQIVECHVRCLPSTNALPRITMQRVERKATPFWLLERKLERSGHDTDTSPALASQRQDDQNTAL